jgi:hypothetical protein
MNVSKPTAKYGAENDATRGDGVPRAGERDAVRQGEALSLSAASKARRSISLARALLVWYRRGRKLTRTAPGLHQCHPTTRFVKPNQLPSLTTNTSRPYHTDVRATANVDTQRLIPHEYEESTILRHIDGYVVADTARVCVVVRAQLASELKVEARAWLLRQVGVQGPGLYLWRSPVV